MTTLRHRPLVWFFALAYLGSWIVWIPVVLTRAGLGVLPVDVPLGLQSLLNVLALFLGPFLAALVMTRATEGSTRPFWRKLVQVRTRPLAWVLALVAIPLAIAAVTLLQPAASRSVPAGMPAGVPPLAVALVAFVPFLIGGPVEEEPGWRGFALPRLDAALHPAAAAGLLGVLWALWHLPQFWLKAWDTPHEGVGDFLAFVLFAVALSVVLSWIAHAGRGSVLVAILAHNAVNWALTFLPLILGHAAPSLWWGTAAMAVLAAIGLAVTRGRLGLPAVGDATFTEASQTADGAHTRAS